MIVVADTSPLNYVVQLDLIEELRVIYGHIVLPSAVRQEMLHPKAPESVCRWAASLPDWVELKRPSALDPTLSLALGAGEREAISLALELHPSILLIDDLRGRIAAAERSIPVTGTLTVLMQAALLAHLDFDLKLEELRQLGFRASEPVVERIRERFSNNQG